MFVCLCSLSYLIAANASANQPLLNVSTWPLQSHSMSSARATPENKVLNHNSARAEGPTDLDLSQAPQAARDQAFRPFIAQNTPANLPGVHQPVQGMKVVQPSSFFNNHNELLKLFRKYCNQNFLNIPHGLHPQGNI